MVGLICDFCKTTITPKEHFYHIRYATFTSDSDNLKIEPEYHSELSESYTSCDRCFSKWRYTKFVKECIQEEESV